MEVFNNKTISTKIDYEYNAYGVWRSVKCYIYYLRKNHCSLGSCFDPHNPEDLRACAVEMKKQGHPIRKKIRTIVHVDRLDVVEL